MQVSDNYRVGDFMTKKEDLKVVNPTMTIERGDLSLCISGLTFFIETQFDFFIDFLQHWRSSWRTESPVSQWLMMTGNWYILYFSQILFEH